MSRSYKKFPLAKQGKSNKVGKKFANRRVRRQIKRGIDIPSGRSYKKVYESWDICDYRWTKSKADTIQDWEEDQKQIANGVNTWKANYPQTKEEAIIEWYKFYKRK